MICPNCKTEYPSGKFCPECGCALESPAVANWCPICRTEYQDGKFCPECGEKLIPRPSSCNVSSDLNLSTVHNEDTFQDSDLFEQARKFEFGIGTDQDIERAAQLYLQAAQKGNADAMCHIGYLMLFGIGCDRHTGNAIRWMEEGMSKSTDPHSLYYKNADLLLSKIKVSPNKLFMNLPADTRLSSFQDLLEDYNSWANALDCVFLWLEDGKVYGTAVDTISLHYNVEEKQHYMGFASMFPNNSFINITLRERTKQSYLEGRLRYDLIQLFREMIFLGID